MQWDGPDAFEPPKDEPPLQATAKKLKTQSIERTEETTQVEEAKWIKNQRLSSPMESSDDGSGDEYIDDVVAAGAKRKRRVRAFALAWSYVTHSQGRCSTCQQNTLSNSRRVIAMSSDSDDDGDGQVRRRGPGPATTARIKSSASPQPSGALKRKQSLSAAGVGTGKRKRAESSSTVMSAMEDAARKYCLGKFTEMFTGIFLQYPYVRQKGEAQEKGVEGGEETELGLVERKAEELSEDEKTQIKERATSFAAEVEQAIFATYAEPDKFGKLGAGAKYKYVLTCSVPSMDAYS